MLPQSIRMILFAGVAILPGVLPQDAHAAPSIADCDSIFHGYTHNGFRYRELFAEEIEAVKPGLEQLQKRMSQVVQTENNFRVKAKLPPLAPQVHADRSYDPASKTLPRIWVDTAETSGTSKPESVYFAVGGDKVLTYPALSDFYEQGRAYFFDGNDRLVKTQTAAQFFVDRLTRGVQSIRLIHGGDQTEIQYWQNGMYHHLFNHIHRGWGHTEKVVYFSLEKPGFFYYDKNTHWVEMSLTATELREMAAKDQLFVGMQNVFQQEPPLTGEQPGMFELAFKASAWRTLIPHLQGAKELPHDGDNAPDVELSGCIDCKNGQIKAGRSKP